MSSSPVTASTQSPSHTPVAEPVIPGVFRIACPFGEGAIVHVYFIDAPEPALVDTGVSANPRGTIEPALNSIGKTLTDVRHIFNTHGHWDHMGGNEQARRLAPEAKTYVHENDRHLLDTVEAHTRGYSSYAARLLETPGGLDAVDRLQRDSIGAPTPADVLVTDGLEVSLGGGLTVRVVTTHGHSFGAVSYLLEPARVLFTGDGIQAQGSRPGTLPLVFDDSQAYRASIAKVSALDVRALCMGHGYSGLTPQSGTDPVRQGDAARQFLIESGEAAKVIEEATRSILAQQPDTAFKPFARELFQRLQKSLGTTLDENGMNERSMATAHAFYREITGAPLPDRS